MHFSVAVVRYFTSGCADVTPEHYTERLEACPSVYDERRVRQAVRFDVEPMKKVSVAYHTGHLVSDTGRMALASGFEKGHREAIIGLLHDRGDEFEIEPIVMGAPWLDHPRNGKAGGEALWLGYDFGEILPEDIEQFARMKDITVASADEWMTAMKAVPEAHVKLTIASLLTEPAKCDWGGEENDHYSANVIVSDRRRTAAFFLRLL